MGEGNVRILVLEDSAFMRGHIIKELKDIGFSDSQIHQANGGAVAIQKISEQSFDLFLLDIVMPVQYAVGDGKKSYCHLPNGKGVGPIVFNFMPSLVGS